MAGIQIRTKSRTLDKVRRKLAKLSIFDTKDLLDNIGAMVEGQTRGRFEEETDPDGNKWDTLDPAYAAWKRKRSSGTILRLFSNMFDSITHNVGNDEVEVGVIAVSPGGFNYGDQNQKTRPFLGLSDQNEDDVEGLTVDWFKKRFSL